MKQKIIDNLKDQLAKIPGRLITTAAVIAVSGLTIWAMAAFTEPTSGPAASVQDFAKNILGANNADNGFDSSSVVANADGSLIERAEYTQTNMGNLDATVSSRASQTSVNSISSSLSGAGCFNTFCGCTDYTSPYCPCTPPSCPSGYTSIGESGTYLIGYNSYYNSPIRNNTRYCCK